MIIIASTTKPTERTLYSYTPPAVYPGHTGKSFTLHKVSKPDATVGKIANLPISQCQVEPEQEGYVLVNIPDWLADKKKSFFES